MPFSLPSLSLHVHLYVCAWVSVMRTRLFATCWQIQDIWCLSWCWLYGRNGARWIMLGGIIIIKNTVPPINYSKRKQYRLFPWQLILTCISVSVCCIHINNATPYDLHPVATVSAYTQEAVCHLCPILMQKAGVCVPSHASNRACFFIDLQPPSFSNPQTYGDKTSKYSTVCCRWCNGTHHFSNFFPDSVTTSNPTCPHT